MELSSHCIIISEVTSSLQYRRKSCHGINVKLRIVNQFVITIYIYF